MAWNKYYIFVKSPKTKDLGQILNQLNLGHFKPTETVPLHYSNKPETLFAGFYNDNLLLVHPDLPFDFFNPKKPETEKLFAKVFPNNEIGVLIENSTVGLFSFAIIKDGQKIRMKDGSDGEYYNDVGEELPEEREALSQKIFEDEEIDEMKEMEMTDEDIEASRKFQASWQVPNLLSKRYLGEFVSDIDTKKVKLTKYN
jgi:hypothetical protein